LVRDVWGRINELDERSQLRLIGVLETRGNDSVQQKMRKQLLDGIRFPERAVVLELGCGTGVLTQRIADRPNVSALVAVDSAPRFLGVARRRLHEVRLVSFLEADVRWLPLRGNSFDVVVVDSCLAHVTQPELVLQEVLRVLRPNGQLAVFEGDYASATVALGDFDPLQQAVNAAMALTATNRYIVRELPWLLRKHGGIVEKSTLYAYVDPAEDGYMMSLVDRGAECLVAEGILPDAQAAALREVARHRARAGQFFGLINYATLVGRKPASRFRSVV
jgi:ubiquinone/menaquinone biosynthesis C-methylase UbiE